MTGARRASGSRHSTVRPSHRPSAASAAASTERWPGHDTTQAREAPPLAASTASQGEATGARRPTREGTSTPPGSRWPGTSAGSPGRAYRAAPRRPPGPPRRRTTALAASAHGRFEGLRGARRRRSRGCPWRRGPAPAGSRPRTRPAAPGEPRGPPRPGLSRRPRSASTSPMVSAPVVQAAMHCAQSMQRCSSTIGRPFRTRSACVGQTARQARQSRHRSAEA